MAPMLRIYDWEKPTVVESDASDWSVEGTPLQKGELQLVVYCNSNHSAQECNYDMYAKELFIVLKALEEWLRELEGSS
jgi:hypothetical protein